MVFSQRRKPMTATKRTQGGERHPDGMNLGQDQRTRGQTLGIFLSKPSFRTDSKGNRPSPDTPEILMLSNADLAAPEPLTIDEEGKET
jgi:hypothetical protein